jgi:hypothetical protein
VGTSLVGVVYGSAIDLSRGGTSSLAGALHLVVLLTSRVGVPVLLEFVTVGPLAWGSINCGEKN